MALLEFLEHMAIEGTERKYYLCRTYVRYFQTHLNYYNTGVLISSWPDQEGNNLMFLPEWREFPPAPCLAAKKT